jgi:putative acetyltransferase
MIAQVSKDLNFMISIRPETPSDYEAIEQITIAAFSGKPYSDQTEHLVIRRLREAGALSLSLVAEIGGTIVGHIALSVVEINGEDQQWFGLGPVSVLPKFQKQGIGSTLIKEGLTRLCGLGAKGCVLEGNPDYYQRFGFKSYPNLIYEGAPAAIYFMALPFYNEVPDGKVEFHRAFYAPVQP